MNLRTSMSLGIVAAIAQSAIATDIPVTPKKLVVVDKLVAAGKAKVAFVVKDPAVTKGAGVDAEQIGIQVDLAYGTGSAAGSFVVPTGTANGWVANKSTVAKFVNKAAPAGPTETKVAVIKPAKLLKLVGKGLGDTDFDILAAGDPGGSVFTAYCVDNAGEENCHCSEFTGCVHKAIGGGTGAKLVCKSGAGDGACTAASAPPCGLSDTGSTVLDTCNGLEWEKKDSADTTPGQGTPNPGNLHDVDNPYAWAGACTISGDLCQPDAAAAATCAAQTGGALGCAECGIGTTCVVSGTNPLSGASAITTVWDWVNQLNAGSFAGHTDWRLATVSKDGDAAEMETIITNQPAPDPCIDPIFGPTASYAYWSASTDAGTPTNAWWGDFGHCAPTPIVLSSSKEAGQALFVRAVRDLP